MQKLRSMTGFGSASSEDQDYALRVELRSVNHRHFLLKARLPQEFGHLEAEVERLLRKVLDRGAVSVHLSAVRGPAAAAVHLDFELAQRYRAELERLGRHLGVPGEVGLQTLLGLPGVVGARESGEQGAERASARVLELVSRALEELRRMREQEGAALGSDLRRNAAAMLKLVARIEKRMPRVAREHQRALQRRVAELLTDKHPGVSPADLAREIALIADRLDVSEEVTRLRSHLEQLETTLAGGGPVGRKLDFLVQEIFREVNTVGSKCSDAQVAHWVVDAKSHAERLREQVQNLE
jgi:uncharacterized protein (TIGR00255 family)